MNKGKVLLATSALLLSASVLVACSGGKSGSSGGQTYSYVYTQDPDTLDYSISNKNRLPSLQEMRWMAYWKLTSMGI